MRRAYMASVNNKMELISNEYASTSQWGGESKRGISGSNLVYISCPKSLKIGNLFEKSKKKWLLLAKRRTYQYRLWKLSRCSIFSSQARRWDHRGESQSEKLCIIWVWTRAKLQNMPWHAINIHIRNPFSLTNWIRITFLFSVFNVLKKKVMTWHWDFSLSFLLHCLQHNSVHGCIKK